MKIKKNLSIFALILILPLCLLIGCKKELKTQEELYQIYKTVYSKTFGDKLVSYTNTRTDNNIQQNISINGETLEMFNYISSDNFMIYIQTTDGYNYYRLSGGTKTAHFIDTNTYTDLFIGQPLPATFDAYKLSKPDYEISITKTNNTYTLSEEKDGIKETTCFSDDFLISSTCDGNSEIFSLGFYSDKFDELKAIVLDPANGFPTPTPSE